jgi:hypothetical protein
MGATRACVMYVVARGSRDGGVCGMYRRALVAHDGDVVGAHDWDVYEIDQASASCAALQRTGPSG